MGKVCHPLRLVRTKDIGPLLGHGLAPTWNWETLANGNFTKCCRSKCQANFVLLVLGRLNTKNNETSVSLDGRCYFEC